TKLASLEPVIEPVQRERVLIDRRWIAVENIAADGASCPVRPRAHQQLLRRLLQARQRREVFQHTGAEVVIPAREEVGGDIFHQLVVSGGVETLLLPVAVMGWMVVKVRVHLLVERKVFEYLGTLARGQREPGFRILSGAI